MLNFNKNNYFSCLKADQNGDGVVDQSEFISVMLKTNLY